MRVHSPHVCFLCLQVSVDFYVESSADDETLGVAEAFSSEWGDRGLVQTHFRVLKGGLIRAVTESFFPSDRSVVAAILDCCEPCSPEPSWNLN